jgi:hypothetical protein
VHESTVAVKVIAAIQSEVEAYAVLDLLFSDNILQVYAVQIQDHKRTLAILTLQGKNKMVHYTQLQMESKQCGD